MPTPLSIFNFFAHKRLQSMRPRMVRLAERHPTLSFIACGQSIARLKREGVDVVLPPEASVASSAISETLTRMQKGWGHVKV